jgi:hypothetical protein
MEASRCLFSAGHPNCPDFRFDFLIAYGAPFRRFRPYIVQQPHGFYLPDKRKGLVKVSARNIQHYRRRFAIIGYGEFTFPA